MTDERSLSASLTVDAPPERVFALLADPDRHPDIDGSGMVRRSHVHLALTEVGEVFGMDMRTADDREYTVENHVVVLEPDRALGWAPALPGQDPVGHTWTFRLEPTDTDATVVTETYDWSAVTDPDMLAAFPLVDRDGLAATLGRLAEALG